MESYKIGQKWKKKYRENVELVVPQQNTFRSS